MIFDSTGGLERLYMYQDNNFNVRHWVDITMGTEDEESTFSVTICCNDEWIWEFYYTQTNYDLVKHMIMDCIFEAEDINDLIDKMDETFEIYFSEIVVGTAELEEDYFECDGDCDNCSFNEDKYLH